MSTKKAIEDYAAHMAVAQEHLDILVRGRDQAPARETARKTPADYAAVVDLSLRAAAELREGIQVGLFQTPEEDDEGEAAWEEKKRKLREEHGF